VITVYTIILSYAIVCSHCCHEMPLFTGLQSAPPHIHLWVELGHQNEVLVRIHHIVHQPVFHLTNSDSPCPIMNLVTSAAGRHSNMTGKVVVWKSSTWVKLLSCCYVLLRMLVGRWYRWEVVCEESQRKFLILVCVAIRSAV